MADRAYSVPRPWRKYLRFSVSGLIVVVLLNGVWLAWLVREPCAARRCGGDHPSGRQRRV